MKNYAFLFWAYNVFWLGMAAWLWIQIRRTAALDRRLDRLESRFDDQSSNDR